MGGFEESVLAAVMEFTARDAQGAYGAPIRERVIEMCGREVNVGAIAVALNRLEAKGYLSVTATNPIPIPGGKSKRMFRIEPAGVQAMKKSREASRSVYAVFDKLEKQFESS